MIVLEDFCQGGSHKRLAEADDVANQDAAALIKMMRRDLYRSLLIGEQALPKLGRNSELD